MSKYGEMIAEKNQSQREQARSDQKLNNAGGYVFTLDDWARLDRFLILGSDSNTYYCSEKKITKDNLAAVQRCIQLDGPRTIARIVEISDSGRAPKNDPALFALAACCGATDNVTRKLALDSLPKVARIGTHLFHFAADVEHFRKWGRGLRTAVAKWYTEQTPQKLAVQAAKYQQRDGWSHRDLLRLSHATAPSPEHDAIFRWIVGGTEALGERKIERREHGGKDVKRQDSYAAVTLPAFLVAFEKLKKSADVMEVVALINEYGFTHEMIPTEWKNHAGVWSALLATMPMTAMIRNLGKLTSAGVVAPLSYGAKHVVNMLGNTDALKKARVHPMAILVALKVYAQGHGEKGSLSWQPVPAVLDALDSAFYESFVNVVPTGKNTLIALDVSGSMSSSTCVGTGALRACEATAAVALLVAKTEANYHIVGFADKIRDLGISPKMRLDQAMKKVLLANFGSTDCGAPMMWAYQEKIPVETFVVMTDNETYAGDVHPYQAIRAYRDKMGLNAKLAVFGVSATEFTIADPRDSGMMDFVGFDAAAPQLASDFARG